MGVVEKAKHWIENEAGAEQRAAVAERLKPPGGLLAAINAVEMSGPQMRAAVDAIRHVPIRTQNDALEHARILSGFAKEYGFPSPYSGPALHMRVNAMDRWCRGYDPEGRTDRNAFFEAAARHPLVQTERGMAFEPASFGELVQFITDMPF